MDINIKALEIEHTEAIDAYVEEKVGKLEKFLQSVQTPHSAHVEIGKSTGHHKNGAVMTCHVHLTLPGTTLHAENEATDLYAAIDMAADDLERQIVKFKETRGGNEREEEVTETE